MHFQEVTNLHPFLSLIRTVKRKYVVSLSRIGLIVFLDRHWNACETHWPNIVHGY